MAEVVLFSCIIVGVSCVVFIIIFAAHSDKIRNFKHDNEKYR